MSSAESVLFDYTRQDASGASCTAHAWAKVPPALPADEKAAVKARIKELLVQSEEDHKAVGILQDSVDKLTEKVKLYKRQLVETEGTTQTNLSRVRRFQRELEAAEDRADQAESNLTMIRAKHRSWVTTSQIPGGTRQVFVTQTEQEY